MRHHIKAAVFIVFVVFFIHITQGVSPGYALGLAVIINFISCFVKAHSINIRVEELVPNRLAYEVVEELARRDNILALVNQLAVLGKVVINRVNKVVGIFNQFIDTVSMGRLAALLA